MQQKFKFALSTLNRKRIEKGALKIVSVFISVFLWFYVLNSEPQEITKQMKIEFISPDGLAVSAMNFSTINVELRGARAFINEILPREEKVVVNLNKYPYKKGKDFTIHIGPNDIPIPFGVDVLSVTPNALSVRLDREIKKYVPIKVNLVGGLPSELKMVKQDINPNRVMLQGPVELMRSIGTAKTVPIDISELEGEGEVKTTLADIDERISYDREQPISFTYDIKAKKANLTLKNIPIRFLSSSKILKASSRKVSLDVLAPEGMSIRSSQVQVVADIPDESKGNVEIKLKANLPDGVHLLQINPQSINVTVR